MFEDGFESGDYSNWDNQMKLVGNGGSGQVVSTQKKEGTYSSQDSVPSGTNPSSYVRKTLVTHYQYHNQRAYFRLSGLPTTGKRYHFFEGLAEGMGHIELVSLINDDGTLKWRLRALMSDWQWHEATSTDHIPSTDTWFGLEIQRQSGAVKLFVTENGTEYEVISISGGSLGGSWGVNIFSFGFYNYYDTNYDAVTEYIDSCVIADAHIGPISEGQLYEIFVDAAVEVSADPVLQTTFNIEKEAITQASATQIPQTTFNIAKDAITQASAIQIPETSFNIIKNAITKASADVLIEIVGGIIEIFKDAIVQAQATFTVESILNIEKDAVTEADATVNVETIFNVVKEAIAQVSAIPQILGIYPINVDATVQASATMQLQQTLGINKDAIVVAVSTPAIQSTFNISKDVVVKVLAEVSVVKEGEIKVTKIFLMIGNLAIQLTGD